MPRHIKRNNLKPPQRCIFCGRVGDMTKEHILPDWLDEIFPKDPSQKHEHVKLRINTIAEGQRTTEHERKLFSGHSLTKKIRRVCRECNNGWMSDIERTVKDLLLSLIKGEAKNFTVTEQRLLAAWAAKTSMTSEFSFGSIGISQEQRTYLFRNKLPPDGFSIWIAELDSPEWNAQLHHHGMGMSLTKLENPLVRPPNVQSTTFGLGRFITYVFSSSIGLVFEPKDEIRFLRKIWPAENEFDWPTGFPLSTNAANILAGSLGDATGNGRLTRINLRST